MEPKKLAADILDTLNEGPMVYRDIPPTGWKVEYFAVTPKGSRTRFMRNGSLQQIRLAVSETAVLYHLKSIHPGCDIIIQKLQFV